mmetsp:Transcript_12327/g.18685  ORF Transcript_12327/g.18685 Transcript_12327/m.18685 type:complete len:224 (+) Transcript_12327:81-752(+)|eukprot:CAMPEP_0185017558 /NCGR_PEP_ID=MMETSP1103-20130426/498_1 /TAXON_ID=36769 /ORGANISM="Paraphysomonas bandaiensis, Strain Caron Lab Isolate" /LENGTH=223 /DNA_ID=CAMNT_0027547023 /DNA_START=38 /DNA_END=709 /DNA_ORIENTATION=+
MATPNVTKLHFFPLSQPSRSVRMLCREANIDVEEVEINIMSGENKKPEYLAVNPTGLVPFLEDGDLGLSEGAAILTYLAESRKLTSWYPEDLRVRAKVNQWLHWNHTNTRMSTSKLLVPAVILKMEIKEADMEAMKRSLSFLDTHLENNTFVAGTEAPTIADLIILPELDQIHTDAFGLLDLTPYSHIMRYIGALKAALNSYDEMTAPVLHVASTVRAEKASA